MRVGTKLMVLVLLPVCGLLAFASVAAIDHWRAADRLRDFRSATRLSFAAAGVAEAVANERTAVIVSRSTSRAGCRPRVAGSTRCAGRRPADRSA
jgi:hypothetical protein